MPLRDLGQRAFFQKAETDEFLVFRREFADDRDHPMHIDLIVKSLNFIANDGGFGRESESLLPFSFAQ